MQNNMVSQVIFVLILKKKQTENIVCLQLLTIFSTRRNWVKKASVSTA